MPAVLTQTRSVLERISENPTGEGYFCFSQLPEPGEEFRSHVVYVDPDIYDDLGRPDVITVTIVPGDDLNKGDA